VGRPVVTGQLPLSPVVFWLLAELAELCPTQARLPARAKGREIPGGNKRGTSTGRKFLPLQAPTKEGLDGVERARTIRRTAAKKRRRHQVRGRRSSAEPALDPTAGRASGRPPGRSAAKTQGF